MMRPGGFSTVMSLPRLSRTVNGKETAGAGAAVGTGGTVTVGVGAAAGAQPAKVKTDARARTTIADKESSVPQGGTDGV